MVILVLMSSYLSFSMRRLLLILLSVFSFQVFAYFPLSYLPQGSRVGLSVIAKNQQQLSINDQQLFPPASTLKIVTALAAKLELGDNFRFATQIERHNSDVVIRFSGDPTLTSDDLDALFLQFSSQGSKEIKGNLLLDNSAFTGYERGVGWPWDILGVCYSAPASAITLDSNCVQASIYSKKNGSTRVHVPAHQPIVVTSTTSTVSKTEMKEQQCDLELTTSDNNHYLLSGCMTERKKPLPLKFAVQDTSMYAIATIKRLMYKYNIRLSGEILVKSSTTGDIIATHHSKPLPELLSIMLKKSNNLIADNLTKTMGKRFFVQAGSFTNGTEAIKQIIYSKTNINLNDAQLADGSGLSRNNRMTVSDMSQVLNYIWKNDKELDLLQLLPIAGESGTLKYRQSMRKAPIKGQLQAKSGSLYGSYNMAGYMLDKTGQPKGTFVQFITDYYIDKRESDASITPPIFQFEKHFFNDLVNLNLRSGSLQ